MKLLGALLILASGFLMGITGVKQLKKRERELLELKQLMQRFRTGIGFSSWGLEELTLRNTDIALCRAAKAFLEKGEEPKAALSRAGEGLFSKKEDAALYRGFLLGLGTSGAQEQLKHIELYDELLSANLSKAKEEVEAKSKVYLALGTFGGVALCLILL